MLTKIIKKIISLIFGKKKFQKIFESLNLFSLAGMNIGGGGHLESSGEKNAMNYINSYFQPLNDLIIFDVGANVGHYSILLKEIFGEKAIIHSFEPSKKHLIN